MDEAISKRAAMRTDKVASHKFKAVGRLFVNDQDTESYVGSVDYMPNHLCRIDCALDTNGWIFCIERMFTNDFKPVFGAFHAGGHYSFAEIEEPKDGETMENTLILLVISNFWHILHPDCFDGGLPEEGKPVKVSWQVELIPMSNQ